MKNIFLIGSFLFACLSNSVFGHGIPQSQVPSVIVNSFQQAFPKAFDVEWEMDGDNYLVEFETSLLGTDHKAWYDKTGKLLKHKEDIPKSDLPQKVLAKVSSDFKDYRIDDVEKITEGSNVTYKMELKTFNEEWKVCFDQEGNVLSKAAD